MAYIQPNSTIEFFTELGFDSSYENSLYFGSTASKDSYFSNLTKIATCTALTYSREERGFVRVELPMSTLLGAGYMRFKNTSFENKWFYAFITSVEYVNNVTTQINFELDVLMTWMGAFQFNQCFIERQHAVTDTIGTNIIAEPLECSTYVCEGSHNSPEGAFENYSIIVYKVPRNDTMPWVQNMYVPVAAFEYEFSLEGSAECDEYLETLPATEAKEIFCIKVVPSAFADKGEDSPVSISETYNKPYSTVDGYIPKNNKLFTFPFKYLTAINMEGDSHNYRYEFFETPTSSTTYTFRLLGTAVSPNPHVVLIPSDYCGVPSNFNEIMTMNKFPSCAWYDDTYKAYLAQVDSTYFRNLIPNAVGASGGVSYTKEPAVSDAEYAYRRKKRLPIPMDTIAHVAGPIPAAASVLKDTIGAVSEHMSPPPLANTPMGVQNSDVFVQSYDKEFKFYNMAIPYQLAQRYDQFLTMYGYAQKRVATPNINARTYFTYIKTIGCSIEPKSGQTLPADDAKQIESIIDNGCRFWKNHTNIGDYTLDNSIL